MWQDGDLHMGRRDGGLTTPVPQPKCHELGNHKRPNYMAASEDFLQCSIQVPKCQELQKR